MSLDGQLIIQKCTTAFAVEENKSECNYMLRSIATACGVNTDGFLSNINANQQTYALIQKCQDPNSGWTYLGQGDGGAHSALTYANNGYFVVAGWISTTGHGHVTVVNLGPAQTAGWPIGTWGMHNHPENARLCHSIRFSFGEDKRPTTKFFARELP